MNVFFKINGKIVTPSLSGSILPGVTRDSVIQLCKYLKLPVEEKRISVQELVKACREVRLEEAFGSGTAAVISPIGTLRYQDEVFTINNKEIGPVSQKLYDTLLAIQNDQGPDPFHWRCPVC